MKIANEKVVVSLAFTMYNEQGEVLDASEPGVEWTFLMGSQEAPPGLEAALLDRSVGDKFSLTLAPEDGYGVHDPELVQTIDRSDLEIGDEVIEVGMQLEAETDDGWTWVTVREVTDKSITLDPNHELAGQTLKFDIEVVDVREATPEEIEHGHAHSDEESCDEEWIEGEEDFEFDEEDDNDDDVDEIEPGKTK